MKRKETLTIDLSSRSIRRAIDFMEEYSVALYTDLLKGFDKLAQNAADVCQTIYGQSVKVEAVNVASGENIIYEIRASGRAVGFLEFGAGSTTDESHPFASEAPFEVYDGSYSEENDGEYARTKAVYGYGYWHFGGRVYYYRLPRRGLFYASEHMINHVAETIKREFK